MELWDLYDENRVRTGRTMIRGEEIPTDLCHLVVHVWIRNSAGEYLISQRGSDRPTFPLKWECVGGSVVAGEDSLTGAIRETKEEVGVELNPDSGRVVMSKTRRIVDGKKYNDILDVWLFRYDGPVDLTDATTAEVAQVRWMTVPQIRAVMDAGELVYTLEYFFDVIAEQEDEI